MNAEQLTALLKNELEIDEAHVKLDGANVNIIAVGEIFASLNRVKSQQMVYQPQ